MLYGCKQQILFNTWLNVTTLTHAIKTNQAGIFSVAFIFIPSLSIHLNNDCLRAVYVKQQI